MWKPFSSWKRKRRRASARAVAPGAFAWLCLALSGSVSASEPQPATATAEELAQVEPAVEPAVEQELEIGAAPPETTAASEDEEEIIIRGYRIAPTDQSTGFGETIDVSEHAATMSTVSEVISEASGVQVRRTGGLGSYGEVSIRGSTPSQVPVYLDGMQLNAGGFSAVDLGQLSLDTLQSVEIYRGSSPRSLGPSGIGGALSLKTREYDEPVSEVAYSQGSWNTMRALSAHGDRLGPVDTLLLLSGHYSSGDFVHFNTQGTRFDTSDDRFLPRRNNQSRSGSALLKLKGPLDGWQWKLGENLHNQWQGLPGIQGSPTRLANLSTLRNHLTLAVGGSLGSSVTLDLDAGHLLLRDYFDDASNEIGVGPQRTRTDIDALSVGSLLQIEYSEQHTGRLRVDGRVERFACREQLEAIEAEPRTRLQGTAGTEHQWRPWPALSLVPALEVEIDHSSFGGGRASCLDRDEIPAPASTVNDLFLSPSFGTRWEALPGLVLRANLGRYARVPGITELFGERGMVQGNSELTPETGVNADAGFSYAIPELGPLSAVRLDAAVFGSRTDDLIVYVQNSQDTIGPANLDAAEILGVESALRLALLGVVRLQSNYTYLHTVNRSSASYYYGRSLPGRPEHEAYGKLSVVQGFAGWSCKAWIDGDYAAETFLDPANNDSAVHRLLLGLGVRVERPAEGLTFTVEITNLLDTLYIEDADGQLWPIRDIRGFPLPGRSIYTTLHWRS